MPSPLPVTFLRQIEAELCRAKHRSGWWDGVENDAGAVGRMIGAVIDFRNEPEWVRDRHGDYNQARILETLAAIKLDPAPATLCNFVNGKANVGGNRDWYALAPIILRYLLQGDRGTPTTDQLKMIDRIVGFFFPKNFRPGNVEVDRNEAWYFHPKLKRLDMPATAAEAVAEIRAITFFCSPDASSRGKAKIVRASGLKRFLQVDRKGKLTASGTATLEAIKMGVEVVFIFPKLEEPSEAERSARVFYRHAEKTLGPELIKLLLLVEINPGDLKNGENGTIWAGEYLSRTLRFVYHRCDQVGQDPGGLSWNPWSALMVSRGSKWGPCAYQTDGHDVEAFEQWQQEFLSPSNLRETALAPATTVGHKPRSDKKTANENAWAEPNTVLPGLSQTPGLPVN